jgi:hypothetical protein
LEGSAVALRQNEAFVAERGERRGIGQNRLFKIEKNVGKKKISVVDTHLEAFSSVSKSNQDGPKRAAATIESNKTMADSIYN